MVSLVTSDRAAPPMTTPAATAMSDSSNHKQVPEHDLLTAGEIAAMLRVPIKSVYDLVAMRRIPVIRLGRSLRFLRADVLAWVAKHRVPSLE